MSFFFVPHFPQVSGSTDDSDLWFWLHRCLCGYLAGDLNSVEAWYFASCHLLDMIPEPCVSSPGAVVPCSTVSQEVVNPPPPPMQCQWVGPANGNDLKANYQEEKTDL